MNQSKSSTAFMLSLLVLLLILAGSTFHFFSEMNDNYIMVGSGSEPIKRIINPHKFQQNKKGLIFSLTFLISCGSLAIMIALPSTEHAPIRTQKQKPHPMAEKQGEEAEAAEEQAITEEAEKVGTAQPAHTQKQDDEEINELDMMDEEDLADDTMDISEGEDDVVYGTNDITGIAIMDFVHKFPDSALKFLYRKQLNGKSLTREEEEIYASWEKRGMSRAKVKRYILSLMEWDALPKDPLYEIWKRLRDHIFDTIH